MSLSSGDLRKLAAKRRTSANREEVQSTLEELEETKSAIESWLEKVEEARDALNALLESHGELDEDLISKAGSERITAAVEALLGMLPEEDSSINQFSEYFSEAENGVSNLESMMEDREISADEREDQWGEITDNLNNMADALDELSAVGVKSAASEGD